MLEICVDSIESAINAIKGGTNRLEVCSALSAGGLTPNEVLLTSIKQIINEEARKEEEEEEVEIYSMIRCRDGNFSYSTIEIDFMIKQIESIKSLNVVDGFVFGLLTKHNTIDEINCGKLLKACEPFPVTFHRAFDLTSNPFQSLQTCIKLGFKRILTSGQQVKAENGIDLIANLINKAKDEIIIMPGSGINSNNLLQIAEKTKAKEFHASASIETFPGFSTNQLENLFYKSKICDFNEVKQLREKIKLI